MSMPTFNMIPSEVELMAASRQIDHAIAAQILSYAADWAQGDTHKQLEIVNYLAGMVNSLGKHCWHDIVWTYLMNRIHTLSAKINENVAASRK